MRIGVDACCWSNRRGFGRYVRELVPAMIAAAPQHDFVLVVDRQTAETSAFPDRARLEVVSTRRQPTRAASANGSRSLADLWRLSRAASRLTAEVLFFPAVYSYYPVLGRRPTVVGFHDTTAEQMPRLIFPGFKSRMLWRLKTWMALRQATRILTVSESSRAQITTAFRYPAAAIRVVPEAPASTFTPMSDPELLRRVREKHRLPTADPLLLCVGGISPHKNLHGLLRALDRLRRRRAIPWHLVLVGDHSSDSFYGCHRDLCALASELELTSRITFTGFVSDGDLTLLYNAAALLVFPSFNEGFGLPAAEAMACGLPVAASREGSLPEVLGSAGELFDPRDPDDVARVLAHLLEDADARNRLRHEGLQRARELSWQRAAVATVQLLEEAAQGERL